jgi:hypothetical protein
MNRFFLACVLLLIASAASSMQMGSPSAGAQVIVKSLHIDPPALNQSRYFYVPFDVPVKTKKIEVSYDYDRSNGENVLDIGLFDPLSNDSPLDTTGFRGWSGGRRSSFAVSRESATPGYIAGNIRPGTWKIILGLYRVGKSGVDVKFEIKLTSDQSRSETPTLGPPPSRSLPWLALSQSRTLQPNKLLSKKRWVSGDLHMHTVHSDGDWTVSSLMDAAVAAELDFIAITDHNTYSHHLEIDQQKTTRRIPLVIRGEEITTYGGHANSWGLPSGTLIDFRVTPGDAAAMKRVVDQVHRRHALISINHPFALCAGCSWSYGQEAKGFDAIEVWNGTWDASDEAALKMWDRLLQTGRHIIAIASSDSHRPTNAIGQATTHVEIPALLSEENVLASITAGRVYLTAKPKSPSLVFEAHRCGDRVWKETGDTISLLKSEKLCFRFQANDLPGSSTISLISDGQIVDSTSTNQQGLSKLFEVRADRGLYFRIEIRSEGGTMLALTNPIYVAASSKFSH